MLQEGPAPFIYNFSIHETRSLLLGSYFFRCLTRYLFTISRICFTENLAVTKVLWAVLAPSLELASIHIWSNCWHCKCFATTVKTGSDLLQVWRWSTSHLPSHHDLNLVGLNMFLIYFFTVLHNLTGLANEPNPLNRLTIQTTPLQHSSSLQLKCARPPDNCAGGCNVDLWRDNLASLLRKYRPFCLRIR